MPPTTRYARIQGREVAYQLFGEGEAELVYVWGTVTHLDWYWSDPDLTHLLRRAAARARIMMFDRTGAGLSDPVPWIPTVEERAEELAELIDAVGFHRPHLVGVVDGCPAAVYLAATQPHRIGRLQLLSPWLKGPGPEPWSIPERTYADWLEVVEHWGEGRSLDLLFPSMRNSPFHRRLWGTFERSAMSRGTALQLGDANRALDLTPLLHAIQAPTLVMVNRADPVIPLAGAQAIADAIPDSKLVVLDGEDVGVAYNSDADYAVDESLRFLIGEGPAIDADRAYVTVMFTDIVGSTDLVAAIGDAAWQSLLRDAMRATRDLIGQYGGTEISRLGDGFVVTFAGPAAAVSCGAALIEAMQELDLGLRVGLHSGEVHLLGDEPTGIAMHVAARVCALAQGGQILVTTSTEQLLAGTPVALEPAGEHRLKGVPGLQRLYAATPTVRPDLPVQRPALTVSDRLVGRAVRHAPALSRAMIRMSNRAG